MAGPLAKRRDPHDGSFYTLVELRRKYAEELSEDELLDYFEIDCEPVEDHTILQQVFSAENSGERTQKIDRKIDPEDEKPYSLSELQAKYCADFTEQEVDQYWRIDCRDLDIVVSVDLGCDHRQAAQNGVHRGTSSNEEKRVDPDDGIAYTLAGLQAKYMDEYSESEVRDYWHDCTVASVMSNGSLMEESGGPTTGCWESWLCEVDPDGSLEKYRGSLQSNFSSVSHILESYVRNRPTGKIVDPAFFTELGVTCDADIRLFEQWFSNMDMSDKPSSVERAQECQPPEPARQGDAFAHWLLEVDSDGSLTQYWQFLRDNFDNLSQITDTYVSEVTSNGKSQRMLEHLFFEDLSVVNKAHQALFKLWFLKKCNAGYEEPTPRPVPSEEREEKLGESDQDFAYWPQDVR